MRDEWRDHLAEFLLASETCYAGRGHCFALARFCTAEDAEILTAYLDRYLPRTDLDHDQWYALGALQHIDAELGTAYAARFTAPGGLWHGWVGRYPAQRGPAEQQAAEAKHQFDAYCTTWP